MKNQQRPEIDPPNRPPEIIPDPDTPEKFPSEEPERPPKEPLTQPPGEPPTPPPREPKTPYPKKQVVIP